MAAMPSRRKSYSTNSQSHFGDLNPCALLRGHFQDWMTVWTDDLLGNSLSSWPQHTSTTDPRLLRTRKVWKLDPMISSVEAYPSATQPRVGLQAAGFIGDPSILLITLLNATILAILTRLSADRFSWQGRSFVLSATNLCCI